MFNEQSVTENGIINRLSKLTGIHWSFCVGDSLPRQAQDIFVDTWLKDALCVLNPAIAVQPDYADDVIHKLRGVMAEARHTGLVKANENFHSWLMAEKTLAFGENGDHVTINLIDFEHIERNHFVVSSQVHYIASTEVYFDIVLYVNGIPLVVGEVKTATRPSVSWQDGAADFMGGTKHYWKNVEPFFVPNLLCFASEGKTFAYGAINARVKDWGPWHKTTQREEILPNFASVLNSAEGLLNPQTLLQMLETFALFSTFKTGKNAPPKRIKILPRYPQFEASKQIVARVKAGYPRKGLIWHFQGSGKSLLMLYAARMLRADNDLKNPTVLIVVDRRDLDSQINETFGGADVKNLVKVQSCKKLGDHIEQDSRGILITTIFKFQDVEIDGANPAGLNDRDNIIVLVDEAHRTQEGDLGEKMRWALPNAHFYGLTGTPISGIDRLRKHNRMKWETFYPTLQPLTYLLPKAITSNAFAIHAFAAMIAHNLNVHVIDYGPFEPPARDHVIYEKIEHSHSIPSSDMLDLLFNENPIGDEALAKQASNCYKALLDGIRTLPGYLNLTTYIPNCMEQIYKKEHLRFTEAELHVALLNAPNWLNEWVRARNALFAGNTSLALSHFNTAFEQAKYAAGPLFIPFYIQVCAFCKSQYRLLSTRKEEELFERFYEGLGRSVAGYAVLLGYTPRFERDSNTLLPRSTLPGKSMLIFKEIDSMARTLQNLSTHSLRSTS